MTSCNSLAVGAAEEFVKGFILRLVDLKLAEVGGAPRVLVTFSNAILDKGPESHQKRWEFLADLQVAIEILRAREGPIEDRRRNGAVDVLPIVDKAFRDHWREPFRSWTLRAASRGL